jgi:alpha-D-xyloside xylohydrolase
MSRLADIPVAVPKAIGGTRTSHCSLTFLDDRSVRVRVGREAAQDAQSSDGVRVTHGDGVTTFVTDAMKVEVSHEPFRMRLADPGTTGAAVEIVVIDTSPSTDFGERTAEAYEIHLTPANQNARIYGCGERFDQVNQAGKVVFNESTDLLTSKYDFTYAPIPWFMSSDGFGFLHNTTRASLFDFRTRRRGRYEVRHYTPVETPAIEFTLFFGPALRDVLQAYVRATGQPRLMPEWAFEPLMGPAYPRQLTRALIDEYMDRIDALDLPHRTFYFDGYWETYVGDLVSREHSDIKALVDELHSRGYRVVFWTAPYVSAAAECAVEGVENGYFAQRMPGVGAEPDKSPFRGGAHTGWWGYYIDFTNPEAVAWHQRRLRALLEAGADGFFADFGETQDMRTATFADGSDGDTAGRYYTIPYHQAVADVCREVRGEDFYLTARSGWTGLQQYAGLITGDQGTYYEYIPVVLAALLSGGLSGQPYMSHCLGGYWGDHAKGPFLRWVQFGTFGSLFSIWNQGKFTEPWSFGDDEVVDVYRKYSKLRSELMPHVYSYAERASLTGLPMMQAMGFAFPDDPSASGIEDEYIFGEEFLVAPVYTDDNRRDVYLPAGRRWFDYWTGTEYAGGQTLSYDAPLDVLPLLVRDSSVVASRILDGELAGTARFTFYPGDRHALSVLHGGVASVVRADRAGALRRVTVTSESDDTVLLTIVHATRPRVVTLHGIPLPERAALTRGGEPAWSYDDDEHRLDVLHRPDPNISLVITSSED